jgi:F-type H+-transporting ATPase subunit epsilon
MNLVVLTPEKEVYKGEVKSVKVPGTNGQFEILNNHAPIVAALEQGVITVTDMAGAKHTFDINKGFVEVIRNEVALLVHQNVNKA